MSVASTEAVSTSKKAPLISLIVSARNDSYMGDFKWRFSVAINYLCQSLKKIGRLGDLELVVCDWNSDIPLHTALSLCEEARDVARFIVVPPSIANPIQQEFDCQFPLPIVLNVAIRRAKGTFIAATDSDILFSAASLKSLFALLEENLVEANVNRCFMTAGRRHLPISQILRRPTADELCRYLERNAALLVPEPFHSGTAAPAGLVLMHRDLWFESQSYDEKFVHWGWMDVDLALRLTQKYPLFHLDSFGVTLVHLEHYNGHRDYNPATHFRRTNRSNDTPKFCTDQTEWGLPSLPLGEFAPYVLDAIDDLSTPIETRNHNRFNLFLQGLQNKEDVQKTREFMETVLSELRIHVSDSEKQALLVLCFFALKFRPKTYVESGLRFAIASTIVARSCPGVEILAIVDWERDNEADQAFSNRDDACFTFWASNVLRNVGKHQAYSMFLGGDYDTAVQRLNDAYVGELQVDLAYINGRRNDVIHASQLCRNLMNNGALIIHSDSAEYVLNCYHQIVKCGYKVQFALTDDKKTGILIKES